MSNQQNNNGGRMIIGCRLPNGIVLEHGNRKVTLDGLNKATIKGATYTINRVDRDFWQAWIKDHKDFGPVKSGAIFEAGSESDAKAIAAERKDETTGFEPMRTDGKDKRAGGVKKRDDAPPSDE